MAHETKFLSDIFPTYNEMEDFYLLPSTIGWKNTDNQMTCFNMFSAFGTETSATF